MSPEIKSGQVEKLLEKVPVTRIVLGIFTYSRNKKESFSADSLYYAFHELKRKYPEVFGNFSFYECGNSYGSRELEGILFQMGCARAISMRTDGKYELGTNYISTVKKIFKADGMSRDASDCLSQMALDFKKFLSRYDLVKK